MQLGFALLSPDCVLSGNTARVLRFMSERGFEIVNHRWHQLSVQDINELYVTNRNARPRSRLDELVDELFSLSASLCCLVTSRDGLSSEELHRALLEMKGPSDPFRCRPDQLRRSLGSTNKIMNLVHTSDTPADSLREAAIFFPDVSARKPHVDFNSTLAAILSGGPTAQRSLSGFKILSDLKERALSARLSSKAWSELECTMRREREMLSAHTDQVAVFARLRTLLPQQLLQISAAVTVSDLRALIRRLIEIASRLPRAAADSSMSTLEMLEHNGVGVSSWESLVIRVEEAT